MSICVSNKYVIGIIDYKVGDKLKKLVHTNINGAIREARPDPCEVIFVHPKGRFYTVEFEYGGVKVRESYTVRSDVNPVRLSWW